MITILMTLLAACAPSATTEAGASAPPTTAAPPPTAEAGTAQAIPQISLTALDGEPLSKDTLDGKVVLFVNVASRCGYTPQYEGLEELYQSRKNKGLVIVGAPCNQFGSQEPGSAEEIATFCKLNYGVTFPLLAKQDVNGAERSALYSSLVGSEAGDGRDIKWNFEKFLVNREGQVVGRYGSSTKPQSDELTAAIDALL
ncbi:MAG: glutathione peroxidase-family protein [Cognaticolwellia sp.]|jgi:glutathione peroxidase-family protein